MSLAQPTPFFTVPWGPLIEATIYPRTPGEGDAPFFTVPWGHKLGTVYYPYDPEVARLNAR